MTSSKKSEETGMPTHLNRWHADELTHQNNSSARKKKNQRALENKFTDPATFTSNFCPKRNESLLNGSQKCSATSMNQIISWFRRERWAHRKEEAHTKQNSTFASVHNILEGRYLKQLSLGELFSYW